ncbi:DUF1614 domain-containing protein [Orenia marismortui]|uniref:Putative membrane protein n=1 Tax=Orenia marismortui TaxID=46469 RepID=A0A4R8H9P9_9FIRM|nr:DUF1614 domain-containing protein [Orenia marismortui]TDX52903.1 putative membrane protein [Orenia marismortui]
MPMGVILLILLEIIIYFGFAERMIIKMGLSKTSLIIFFALMIIGSFIDIPITRDPLITINLGGAIVPIVLAFYLLSKMDEKGELFRAIIATLIAGGAIFALTQIYRFEEGHTLIDTNYLFPIISGVVAYLIGRSRKAAFVAGTLGFLVYDLIHVVRITMGGVPGEADIGGAGAFDSIVIGGILAILLAEILGESRENLFKANQESKEKFNKHKLAHSSVEFAELGHKEKEDRGEENE